MRDKRCEVIGCEYKVLAKGFCSTHYKRFMKYGNPNYVKDSRKKLDFEITNKGCFEIKSHIRNKNGYGILRKNGINTAHRFIYTEMFGEIPKGLVVRHKCDNPSCINPEHLELGTIQQNNDDRDKRGRFKKMFGSENGSAKLNEEQVREIKKMLVEGKSVNELSKVFNIGKTTLHLIKRGERWKHVN